jgi:hypothetical protein
LLRADTMARALIVVLLAATWRLGVAFDVRDYLLGHAVQPVAAQRRTSWSLTGSATPTSSPGYYYNISSVQVLGAPNPEAAIGNPLKGLVGNVDFTNYDPQATSIDMSLEFYYIPLDELMFGNPDVVGVDKAFNWTFLESRLEGAKSRRRHMVMTPFVHFPNWGRMSVPKYLIDAGMKQNGYSGFLGGGVSPDYGDPLLLKALEQFITAFGAKYDGDPRLAFVSLGLLGFWVSLVHGTSHLLHDVVVLTCVLLCMQSLCSGRENGTRFRTILYQKRPDKVS